VRSAVLRHPDRVNDALRDVAEGRVRGAAVLEFVVDERGRRKPYDL
jgi:hypothetical protein